ncbi:hypothetical protein NX059_005928 [Plenodomus lindquistii]|nr:hypothetical protein NX059_005928 [Plenodomus lindquistii]
MAPRRGGSSYGSSSSSSTCPGAFEDTQSQVYFACIVLFFLVYIGIAIGLCVVRKKSGAGTRLIGVPYMSALFFMLVAYALDLVSMVLLECGTVASTLYSLAIASSIFYLLAYWTLLFVVVYTLNTLLREHLESPSKAIKMLLLAIVGVMFAITAAHIGVTSYNLWAATDDGYSSNANFIIHPAEQLRVAWNVMYFLSVITAGVLSLLTIFAMRSRRQSGSGLLGWVIALTFSMAVWIIIGVVVAASYLTDDFNIITFETNAALMYIQSFFQAMSFIILLCIARHGAWSKTGAAASMVAPQDHYNQAPVYVMAK